MIKVFISYRREDTLAICGRISDRLKRRFGRESVLMDITTIPAGVDFRDFIAAQIKQVDILLVVVGRKWLDDASAAGNRLFSDNDTLRMEMEVAFSFGVPIIPLLIGDARQPSEEDVPASLKFLPSLNSLRIDEGRDFDHHVEQLVGRIDEIVRSKVALSQARQSLDPPGRTPPDRGCQ